MKDTNILYCHVTSISEIVNELSSFRSLLLHLQAPFVRDVVGNGGQRVSRSSCLACAQPLAYHLPLSPLPSLPVVTFFSRTVPRPPCMIKSTYRPGRGSRRPRRVARRPPAAAPAAPSAAAPSYSCSLSSVCVTTRLTGCGVARLGQLGVRRVRGWRGVRRAAAAARPGPAPWCRRGHVTAKAPKAQFDRRSSFAATWDDKRGEFKNELKKLTLIMLQALQATMKTRVSSELSRVAATSAQDEVIYGCFPHAARFVDKKKKKATASPPSTELRVLPPWRRRRRRAGGLWACGTAGTLCTGPWCSAARASCSRSTGAAKKKRKKEQKKEKQKEKEEEKEKMDR